MILPSAASPAASTSLNLRSQAAGTVEQEHNRSSSAGEAPAAQVFQVFACECSSALESAGRRCGEGSRSKAMAGQVDPHWRLKA